MFPIDTVIVKFFCCLKKKVVGAHVVRMVGTWYHPSSLLLSMYARQNWEFIVYIAKPTRDSNLLRWGVVYTPHFRENQGSKFCITIICYIYRKHNGSNPYSDPEHTRSSVALCCPFLCHSLTTQWIQPVH